MSNTNSKGERPTKELLLGELFELWPHRVTSLGELPDQFGDFNYKFKDATGAIYFLRVSTKLESTLSIELELLKFLAPVVPVPQVLLKEMNVQQLGGHIVVFKFISGSRLSEIEQDLSEEELLQVARSVGSTLARIHGYDFKEGGFLGAGLKIAEAYSQGCIQAFLLFIRTSLKKLLEVGTINENLAQQTEQYILKRAGNLNKIENLTKLVHAEFSPENLIFCQRENTWELSGVLAWSYAFSGPPLMDFGRFLRAPRTAPRAYEDTLAKAYIDAGGKLPEGWRQLSKLFDLVPLLQLLLKIDPSPEQRDKAIQLLEGY